MKKVFSLCFAFSFEFIVRAGLLFEQHRVMKKLSPKHLNVLKAFTVFKHSNTLIKIFCHLFSVLRSKYLFLQHKNLVWAFYQINHLFFLIYFISPRAVSDESTPKHRKLQLINLDYERIKMFTCEIKRHFQDLLLYLVAINFLVPRLPLVETMNYLKQVFRPNLSSKTVE